MTQVLAYALPRPEDPLPNGWTRVRDASAPHGLLDMSPGFAAGLRGEPVAAPVPAAGPWIPVAARMPETLPIDHEHRWEDYRWHLVRQEWHGGAWHIARWAALDPIPIWYDRNDSRVLDVTHWAEIRRPGDTT